MESVLPFANIVARDARSTVQSLNAEPQSWGEGGERQKARVVKAFGIRTVAHVCTMAELHLGRPGCLL